MAPQYAAKADANQPEIVKELRDLNFMASCTHTLGQGRPDVVVGGPTYELGINALVWVEIKGPGGKLTDHEAKFFREWEGMPVIIAYCTQDILDWFGFDSPESVKRRRE